MKRILLLGMFIVTTLLNVHALSASDNANTTYPTEASKSSITTPITQLGYLLSFVLYEADGTTEIYNRFSQISAGLQVPDFPKVGEYLAFNINGTNYSAKITVNRRGYDFGQDGFTTRIYIVAVRN